MAVARLQAEVRALTDLIAVQDAVLDALDPLPPLSWSSVPVAGRTTPLAVARIESSRCYSSRRSNNSLWESLWGSSLLLVDPLYAYARAAMPGKRFLELGGGLMLCSLVVACANNEWEVVGTDVVEDASRVARRSAAANHLNRISFEVLNWNFPHTRVDVDLVVGADVLFGNWCVDPVASAFRIAMSRDTSVGVVADPCRTHEGEFEKKLRELFEFVLVVELRDDQLKKRSNNDDSIKVHRAKLFVFSDSPAAAQEFIRYI